MWHDWFTHNTSTVNSFLAAYVAMLEIHTPKSRALILYYEVCMYAQFDICVVAHVARLEIRRLKSRTRLLYYEVYTHRAAHAESLLKIGVPDAQPLSGAPVLLLEVLVSVTTSMVKKGRQRRKLLVFSKNVFIFVRIILRIFYEFLFSSVWGRQNISQKDPTSFRGWCPP